MAIPLEQKSLAKYLDSFRSSIENRTNLNLFDRDSKIKALIDIFSEQLYNERQEEITAINGLQLSQASNNQLDNIGRGRGVARLQETFATVDKSERNLAFFTQTGTFGDLNEGSSFTIPKGTKVWTNEQQNDLGRTITYILLADVECINTENLVYASARSISSGRDSNVGASVLRNHDFASYSKGSGLQVLNFYSILNGRNRETAEQYRYRISQIYSSISSNSENKAKLIALTIPGVVDTKVIPGYFGIGTVGLIVLGSEYQVNQTLLSLVQKQLDAAALPGVRTIALAPVTALVDFELTLYSTRVLSQVEQKRIYNTIRRLAINYLRLQGLGGTLNFIDLAKILTQELDSSVQFKSSNIETFDYIYIRKNYASNTPSEREAVAQNSYFLNEDTYSDLGTLSVNFE